MPIRYVYPPMKTQLFCRLDERTLVLLGWGEVVEMLDGDISAPNALPSGGAESNGMFGPVTAFVPREREAQTMLLKRLLAPANVQSQSAI